MKMEFIKKYKTPIVIALIVITILVIFYYWSKAQGKKEGIKSVLPEIPNDPTDVTGIDGGDNSLLAEEKVSIKLLADRIYADINDMTPFWRDSDAYATLAAASDRILVGVYNYYFAEFKSSIITDIENETSVSPMVVDSTRTILSRMKNLKLK